MEEKDRVPLETESAPASRTQSEPALPTDASFSRSRRGFLEGAVTVAATAAAGIGLEPILGGTQSVVEASTVPYNSAARADASFEYRRDRAVINHIDIGELPDNGDVNRFTDFSAMYSKALRHDGLGVPNAASWRSLRKALLTGDQSDFANILVGTPGGGPNSRLNDPQGSLAFDLEGRDSHAFVVPPPAPSVASAQTASEQVEHYWAALLRDVPFSQYAVNPLVAQAVADLNSRSFIRSSQNDQFPYPVTPRNLLRGQGFPGDGNVMGPHVSQFMIQPTFFGAQALSQQYLTYLPVGGGGTDYMTSVGEYQLVQAGGDSGRPLIFDSSPRYIRNGRDLTAYTRVDVLYQAYFVAFLVLAGLGAPPPPGHPYIGSTTQKPFGTLGGPDAAGTLGKMATAALKASWNRKWIVDMRLRPEEYGALLQARKTGTTPFPQAAAALHSDVLSSAVLPIIKSIYGSYLLPQAYPEGSPTHPCYTGGHATVAGACCTMLKFFFDGDQKIRPLLLAAGRDVYESTDGFSLQTYSGADRDQMDINGELSKVAFNIAFGHGVHAGIHFRSSNYWGILLGERVALSILRDRARSYNEPFTITIKKFNGQPAVISNQPAFAVDTDF